MLGDAFPGVVRACRGSTRPTPSDGLGQPGTYGFPSRKRLQRDLFPKQRRAARRFIERTREGSSSERLYEHAGRRAFSDGGSRDVGGRATASRGAGMSRGIGGSSTSRSGEAPRLSRGSVRHVPDSTVPHGVERGAGWLRCGDLAMPGVREARASARRTHRSVRRQVSGLRGRPPDDQRSRIQAVEGVGATRATEA